MTVIYSFFFEEEPTKFYIGKSSSFEERKRAHLNALKRGKHHSSKAQSLFDKYCTEPTFLIIEECLEEQAFDKEVEYIRTFDSYKMAGLNHIRDGNYTILVFWRRENEIKLETKNANDDK